LSPTLIVPAASSVPLTRKIVPLQRVPLMLVVRHEISARPMTGPEREPR